MTEAMRQAILQGLREAIREAISEAVPDACVQAIAEAFNRGIAGAFKEAMNAAMKAAMNVRLLPESRGRIAHPQIENCVGRSTEIPQIPQPPINADGRKFRLPRSAFLVSLSSFVVLSEPLALLASWRFRSVPRSSSVICVICVICGCGPGSCHR